MMALQGMVDLVGGSRDQVAQGSQLLFLHQLALQALLAFVTAARLLQQGHERLVLEILAQENESSQQQHRGQHGEDAERRAEGMEICRAERSTGPAPAATGSRAWRAGERVSSIAVQDGAIALADPIRGADRAAAAIHATAPIRGTSYRLPE